MQVHCDEGVAIRIGPEPCAGIREGVGEASAGVRAGQPLSRDRKHFPGADAVCVAEGHMSERADATARMTRRGQNLACTHAPLYGNREISGPTSRSTGLVRIGKARSRSR